MTMEALDEIPDPTRLFNDYFNHANGSAIAISSSYPLFSRFPLEIRRYIWTLSLQQHRLISVTITSPGERPTGGEDNAHQQEQYYYTSTNLLGNTISGRDNMLKVNLYYELHP
jgi:hypothetical protein